MVRTTTHATAYIAIHVTKLVKLVTKLVKLVELGVSVGAATAAQLGEDLVGSRAAHRGGPRVHVQL
eukprot:CAMPEP_0183373146 /NCGR_PEP_ID=MMETSP0164_2-20130417/110576_1 /TAXON_ID=221442 /ORGANISM="Coccolithus pelagicus ssp braarudi, Strain PLY182g" /LENGTH=65 /DNA_ID=CAMNT_0025549975 /DNA_START=238 /DNA_END=435 /DNA_ORIENTATION=+